MPDCEVCGSKNASYISKIEGALLKVCKNCAGSGKIISAPALPIAKKILPRLPKEFQTELIENFSAVVKTEREKRKLSHDRGAGCEPEASTLLARKISVQENLISRIENGWRPPTDLIKKLEKFFGKSLTEKSA